MLQLVVILNVIFGVGWFVDGSSDVDSDFGAGLISSMRNDVNLDLPEDEEYEDLRAELLAYHTALAALTDTKRSRRSMMTTPCWQLGGVCIDVKLCEGYRFLTEVPGCNNRLNVCCFTWNKLRVKDYKAQGISSFMFPWSNQQKFGGKGVMDIDSVEHTSHKIKNKYINSQQEYKQYGENERDRRDYETQVQKHFARPLSKKQIVILKKPEDNVG